MVFDSLQLRRGSESASLQGKLMFSAFARVQTRSGIKFVLRRAVPLWLSIFS